MKKINAIFLVSFIILSGACTDSERKADNNLTLWYQSPATIWADAFPLGNGKLAAMCYGGITNERYQINEESLWSGTQSKSLCREFL